MFSSFSTIEWTLFVKPQVSKPKDALRQVWLKIGPVVLYRMIFKFRQCIFAISLVFPLEKKGVALLLSKLEFPIPKDVLFLVDVAQWL